MSRFLLDSIARRSAQVTQAAQKAGSVTWEHLAAPPSRPPSLPAAKAHSQPELVVTGEGLINDIVNSIEHGQCVLLTGPRGCGKSYCMQEAVDRWVGQKPAQRDFVKLQGNREVGRDFLMESSISFFVYEQDGELKVMPRPSPAPILRYAEMENDFTLRPRFHKVPAAEGKKPGDEVHFGPENPPKPDNAKAAKKPHDGFRHSVVHDPEFRFVLFLDEINRFPDGVLDSLLSIIEEHEIYFEGRQVKVPVTVVMTMNPPGYDATARQLSPPLMARIGRCWKMASPDIDAMSDTILRSKTDARETEIDGILARKACLATLCLWGDPATARGTDYLTQDSLELLEEMMKHDELVLKPAMGTLAGLSRFGPDGRAAAEWIRSAAAKASPGRVVKAHHLEETALASLAHRIYDNFSQASSPDKTAAKEEAIMQIVRRVLFSDHVTRGSGVIRMLDDHSGKALKEHFEKMIAPPAPAAKPASAPVIAPPPEPPPPPPTPDVNAEIKKKWNWAGPAIEAALKGLGFAKAEADLAQREPSPAPPPVRVLELEVGAEQPRPESRIEVMMRLAREKDFFVKLRNDLHAQGLRDEAQVELFWRFFQLDLKAPDETLIEEFFNVQFAHEADAVVQEHAEAPHRRTTRLPRIHPDGICYHRVYHKLKWTALPELKQDASTSVPVRDVWDDGVRLAGVRELMRLLAAKAARHHPKGDVRQPLRQRKLETLIHDRQQWKKLSYQLVEGVRPSRINFYAAACVVECMHKLALAAKFEDINEASEHLALLAEETVQVAHIYHARLGEKLRGLVGGKSTDDTKVPPFAEPEAAEVELILKNFLKHLQDNPRHVILSFLGITKIECARLAEKFGEAMAEKKQPLQGPD